MMQLFKSLTRRKVFLVLAGILPILFLLWVLLTNTVLVSFYDQWELVPIMQHLHSGHFYWMDFWQQHNEHRIIFPRLVLIATAILTHWNTIVECYIDLVIAIGAFLVVLRTFGAKLAQAKTQVAAVLVLLLSLIWFSPLQVENWLWGWQIEWFLNVLGTVLVVYGLSKIKNRSMSRPDCALLVVGGLVAQYSLGNGTLLWPLLLAALLYMGVSRLKLWGVGLVGAVSTGFYYLHYVTPPDGNSRTVLFQEPIAFIKYVLTYIGRPLSFVGRLTPLLGILIAGTFLSLAVYLFVKKRQRFNESMPWLFLGVYALCSAVITGVSRLGFGPMQAYSGRYTTISSLLLVSTIVLCFVHRDLLRDLLKKWYKPASIVTPILLLILVGINAGWGVHSAQGHSQYLRDIQHCTRGANPSRICLLSAYPTENVVKQRLNYLKSIHWGGY